jgi:adenosylmethionine-8-amino-7-oxononanoate aminotransferase
MAPSAVTDFAQQEQDTIAAPIKTFHHSNGHINGAATSNGLKKPERLLGRHLRKVFPAVTGGKGNYLYLADGRTVFDATGGAAVSCLGHDNKRVIKAMTDLMNTGTPYLCSSFWTSSVTEELCKELIDGTGGEMDRAYLIGSGMSSSRHFIQIDS